MGGKDKKELQHAEGDACCDHDNDSDIQSEEEADVEEQVEEKIKQLPNLKDKVQAIAINGYLLEKRKLDKQLQAETEAIEIKFRETFKQFTDEINSIVEGKHNFTDADFQEIGELLTEQQKQTKHNYFTQERISQYWLKVFLSSDVVGENIEQRDQPLLKHLQRIQTTKTPNKLSVTFYFSENQWFTNQKLTKEFDLVEEVIKKSYGDQIAWKEGKNITIKIVKKKNKKKGGEKKTKEVKEKSFFNFFLDIEIESDDDEDAQDDQQQQDIEDLQQQYEIAQHIYEDLQPKSLQYYLGLVEVYDHDEGLDQIEEEDEQDEPPKKKGKKSIKE